MQGDHFGTYQKEHTEIQRKSLSAQKQWPDLITSIQHFITRVKTLISLWTIYLHDNTQLHFTLLLSLKCFQGILHTENVKGILERQWSRKRSYVMKLKLYGNWHILVTGWVPVEDVMLLWLPQPDVGGPTVGNVMSCCEAGDFLKSWKGLSIGAM